MKGRITKLLVETLNQYDDFWNAVWSGDSKSHRAVIEKYFPPFAHLAGLPHSPKHHPEGDVDEHVFLVIDEVAKEKDKELSMSAVFHDLGKANTLEIQQPGNPTYRNHEEYSVDYVRYYRDLIEDMGADYWMVKDLVGQHMRYHKRNEMKSAKRNEMEQSHYYEKLTKLGAADDGVRKIKGGRDNQGKD